MTRLVFTQSGYSMTIVKNCPGLSYLPEPVNYHPGYDMDYVHAYVRDSLYSWSDFNFLGDKCANSIWPSRSIVYITDSAYLWGFEEDLFLKANPVVQDCHIIEVTEDSFINQLYHQKSYSEHKRRQLQERISRAWEKFEHTKNIML
ncbi:16895_t:CDS:2 [Rhizophagus irregularis]|nr:16895_t:CDS:2 [Rhizophagus irregularis]